MKTSAIPRLRIERLDDRITPAGLDPTFDSDGIVTLDLSTGPSDLVITSVTDAAGKVLTLGSYYDPQSEHARLTVSRLNADGTPDTTFGGDGTVDVPLDGSFAGASFLGGVHGAQIALLPDGRVVVVAQTRTAGSLGAPDHAAVARLNADGTPDITFDGDGTATISIADLAVAIQSVAILPDGSVVLAGSEVQDLEPPDAGPLPDEVVAIKLTAAGQLDGSFGTGGVVRITTGTTAPTQARIAALSDGKLLVYGELAVPPPGGESPLGPFAIPGRKVFATRLTAAGAIDTSYGVGGRFEVGPQNGADTLALLSGEVTADGSILVVGVQWAANAAPESVMPQAVPYLFRVSPNGQLDTAFAGDGRLKINSPYVPLGPGSIAIAPMADGGAYLVALGQAGRSEGESTFPEAALVVLKVKPDGTLDTTFGHSGQVVLPESEIGSAGFIPFGATADTAGRLLVSGRSPAWTGDSLGEVIRLASDAPTPPLPPEPPPLPHVVDIVFPMLSGQRTLIADVNGDGTADTIAYSGRGGATLFIRDGRTGETLVNEFRPYESSFNGGLVLAAADLNGDGKAELGVAPDTGGSARIQVLEFVNGQLVVRSNYFAFDDPNFRGGARLAFGDVNGDGTPDLVVTAGPGGGPRVALFNGTTLFGTPARLMNDFYAFTGADEIRLRDGVSVTAGDLNGDGKAELVFGAGAGGAPRVLVFDGALIAAGLIDPSHPLASFYTGGDSDSRGGVAVAIIDQDGNGQPELFTQNVANGDRRVYRDAEALAAAGTPDDALGLILVNAFPVP